MIKAEHEKTGLSGGDKQQDDLRDAAQPSHAMPEGLERERKGPLDKNKGRNEKADHVPGGSK